MGNFPLHEEATRSAERMIGKLPEGSRWSYFVCDDDNPVVPGTLNIYYSKPSWHLIAMLLNLTTVVDSDDDFITYRHGPIHVSLMENPNG